MSNDASNTANNMANDDTFDWQPLGREFWIDAGRHLGASGKQVRWAAAKFRNCSNTECCRQSGYTASTDEGLRSTGYRLFRANVIQKLLAFASAEAGGTGPDGSVTRDEARRILSALARGSDPSVKIRAVEQLSKFDEVDRQQRNALIRKRLLRKSYGPVQRWALRFSRIVIFLRRADPGECRT